MQRVEYFTDVSGLSGLRFAWEDLRARQSRPSINSDPTRFEATVAGLGGGVSPHVSAMWSGDTLAALILARVARASVVVGSGWVRWRVWSTLCIDVVQGGLLHDSSPAAIDWIVKQVATQVASRRMGVVRMNRVPVADPIWVALTRDPCIARQLAPRSQQPYYRTTIPPEGFEALMGRHSGKTRRTLKREARRLTDAARGGAEIVCMSLPEEAGEVLRQGSLLVSRTFHARVGTPFEENLLWRSIVFAEAACGGLRAYFLRVGREPIAFVLGARRRDTLYFDAIAHAPEWARFSPGKRLLLAVLEQEAREGVRLVDFGHGEASYKHFFCDEKHETQDLTVFAAGVSGAVAHGLDSVFRFVDRAGHRVATGIGAAAGVRRLLRRAVETNVGTVDQRDAATELDDDDSSAIGQSARPRPRL